MPTFPAAMAGFKPADPFRHAYWLRAFADRDVADIKRRDVMAALDRMTCGGASKNRYIGQLGRRIHMAAREGSGQRQPGRRHQAAPREPRPDTLAEARGTEPAVARLQGQQEQTALPDVRPRSGLGPEAFGAVAARREDVDTDHLLVTDLIGIAPSAQIPKY